MQIKEVQKRTGLTEKAIKYYEKEGLIKVQRLDNHYRDYTEEDVTVLQKISVYRKCGIDLNHIKKMLENEQEENKVLKEVMHQKEEQLTKDKRVLQLLEGYLKDENTMEELNSLIEYETIAQGLQDLLPGFIGNIFLYHFLPYLQMPLSTDEQKDAYQNLLTYFENAKLPVSLKLSRFLQKILSPHNAKSISEAADKQLQSLMQLSETDYEKAKKQVWNGYKLQQNPLYKYGPSGIMKRRMMKSLKQCGYYDIFLSYMEKLSPSYKQYRDQLMQINQRICDDLHLAYDDDFHLIQTK